MLTVEIVCVGRLKEKYLRDACAEYLKRLEGWAKVKITELEPERLPENPSDTEIAQALELEGNRIEKHLARLPTNSAVMALCIEGEKTDSKGFAARISQSMLGGSSTLGFLIGGSYGLSPRVKKAASGRISMSDMTFPHQLARVMLLEQIYRALNILNGGKYHK